MSELTAALATIEKCREIVGCPEGVDLQDHLRQLAAENAAIREQSEEVYAAGYNHGHLNTVDGIAYAGCVKDDFYGLALQVMAEIETPATDAYLAGIKADGVDLLYASKAAQWPEEYLVEADEFAAQLRNGGAS